jgi:hypothetical protein
MAPLPSGLAKTPRLFGGRSKQSSSPELQYCTTAKEFPMFELFRSLMNSRRSHRSHVQSKKSTTRRRNARPSIEALEDRLVPTLGVIPVGPHLPPETDMFSVIGAPSQLTAGSSFIVNVTEYVIATGQVANWSGYVPLTSSDGGHSWAQGGVNLVNGRGSALVVLTVADTVTVHATLGSLTNPKTYVTGATGPIVVTPGAAASLMVFTPSSAVVGQPFTVMVTALDAYGNVATGFNQVVGIRGNDGQALSRANITSWNNGVGTAVLTPQTAETLTLTASVGAATGSSLFKQASLATLLGSGPRAGSATIVITPDWFSNNISDQDLQTQARTDFQRDGAITFSDMEGLFELAVTDAQITLSAAQLQSLGAIVGNPGVLNIPNYVEYLANQVLNPTAGDLANLGSYFAGTPMFDPLTGNDLPYWGTRCQLSQTQALIDEWFIGMVHPGVNAPDVGTVFYSNDSSDVLFGLGAPSYVDVAQGALGDCTVLASLAEVAFRDPAIIQNMFISDGTANEYGVTVNVWTVCLYNNGQPNYVTVDSMLPSGGGQYDHPQNGSIWVALAEKAYAQMNGQGWLGTLQPGSYSYAALANGNKDTAKQALEAITGLGADSFTTADTLGVITGHKASDVIDDLNAGRFVVIGTPSDAPSPVVASHEYAVLTYDPDADQFLLFNPWGVNNTTGYPGLVVVDGSFIDEHFTSGAETSAAPPTLQPTLHADNGVGLLPNIPANLGIGQQPLAQSGQ